MVVMVMVLVFTVVMPLAHMAPNNPGEAIESSVFLAVKNHDTSKWRAYREFNPDSWFRRPASFALDDRLMVETVRVELTSIRLKGEYNHHYTTFPKLGAPGWI